MALVIQHNPAAKIVIKCPSLLGTSDAASIFTVGTLNIGDKARFRQLANGVVFEVSDDSIIWTEVWRQTVS